MRAMPLQILLLRLKDSFPEQVGMLLTVSPLWKLPAPGSCTPMGRLQMMTSQCKLRQLRRAILASEHPQRRERTCCDHTSAQLLLLPNFSSVLTPISELKLSFRMYFLENPAQALSITQTNSKLFIQILIVLHLQALTDLVGQMDIKEDMLWHCYTNKVYYQQKQPTTTGLEVFLQASQI